MKLQRCNKAAVWDSVPSRGSNPVDPNFRWQCQDGRIMRAQEMHTSHLYNSLKMLWNNTVPRAYVVLPFNHKYKVNIERDQRRWAVGNLFNEIMNRTDRTPAMDEGLRQMAQAVSTMKIKSIKW